MRVRPNRTCFDCGAEMRTWAERNRHDEERLAYGICKALVLTTPEKEIQKRERLKNHPDILKMKARLRDAKMRGE